MNNDEAILEGETLEEVPQYEMTDLRLDGLSQYFDANELKKFIKSTGISPDSRRKGNIALFIDSVNNQHSLDEQRSLINDFNNFFLKSICSKNKIIGISNIGLKRGFFDDSYDDFMDEMDWEECEVNEIFNNEPSYQHYTLDYHKVYYDNSKNITRLELIYSHAYRLIKEGHPERIQYIRVLFNLETDEILFYFQYPVYSLDKNMNKPFNMFADLKTLLENKFHILIQNSDTDRQVFEVYKEYTEYNEKSYKEKIDEVDSSQKGVSVFEDFYERVVSKLDNTLLNVAGKEEYVERLKHVFIRLYIDKYFEDFNSAIKSSKGYITGFVYKDVLGSSVTGKDGNGTKLDEVEINPLQASDTYFDTRDTIYAQKQLLSVRLRLNPQNGINFLHDVRFQAFPNLITLHFIQAPVMEDEANYVLQQFKSIG